MLISILTVTLLRNFFGIVPENSTYIIQVSRLFFWHTPTFILGREHRGKVLFTDTWIDIDTGATYGEHPALFRLDDHKVFYV